MFVACAEKRVRRKSGDKSAPPKRSHRAAPLSPGTSSSGLDDTTESPATHKIESSLLQHPLQKY